MSFYEKFEPNAFYHLYNHANGDEDLFRNEDNYYFFLERYQKYLTPVLKTYAYCLMPNHFHVLVQVKSLEELLDFYNQKHGDNVFLSTWEYDEGIISQVVSQELSNFLNSYTKALNKQQNRKGSLFQPRTRHKKVVEMGYRDFLIMYIHRNPLHHCFSDNFGDWTHSSYQAYLEEKTLVKLEKEEVLKWFDGKENFEKQHQENYEKFLMTEFED